VGTEVTYSAAAGLGTARSVNPERVGGWARGVLTFIDRPLVAVVADLNRYSPRLITIEDEGVRHIRVTGSVTVGGIAEWLRALENVSAVEFDDTGDAMVLRGSRRSASRRSGA
jgi:transmembrane sensor